MKTTEFEKVGEQGEGEDFGFIKVNNKHKIVDINEKARNILSGRITGRLLGEDISVLFADLDENAYDSGENLRYIIDGKEYLLCIFELERGKHKATGLLLADPAANPFISHKTETENCYGLDWCEILEGSFDGILVTDVDGKILYVNSSYERVAEIKRCDMEGKSMRDLINPVWMPNSVAYVVAEQKTVVSKRQVVKSGRHIIVTGRPIFDACGEIKMIVINARDITEIYNLSEELQKSRMAEKMYMDRLSDLSSLVKKETPILATSQAMQNVLSLAEKVAGFQTTVLILGDSGVGKEEVAKYIHKKSMRSKEPFIAVNCGAIPDNLLESELFGYEKGAFTGALHSGKEGLVEAAVGGTIFLDEIAETSLEFQVKLLRFLETKEIRRIGNVKTKTVDVRVIAATNKDLKQMIEEGKFREDLYYRLNVVQIDVPSLAKRVDDIMPLSVFFLQKANEKYNQEKLLTYEVINELEAREWVGNVRELKNVIENMVIVSNNDYLQVDDLPWYRERLVGQKTLQKKHMTVEEALSLSDAMDDFEMKLLLRVKETCSTTREMANRLKVNQSTIVRKLQKYNITLD